MTKVTDLIERLRYTASILEANKHKFTVPDHIPAKAVSVREAADRLEALSSECEVLREAAQPSTEAVKLADEVAERLGSSVGFDGLGRWLHRNGERVLAALRQSPPLPSIDEVRREAFEEAAKVADLEAARACFNSDNAPEQPERYYLAEEVRKRVADAIRDLMRVDAPKGLDDG